MKNLITGHPFFELKFFIDERIYPDAKTDNFVPRNDDTIARSDHRCVEATDRNARKNDLAATVSVTTLST